jgi:hypothetical protein
MVILHSSLLLKKWQMLKWLKHAKRCLSNSKGCCQWCVCFGKSKFDKKVKVHTNANNFGIRGILMQNKHLVAYGSKKLIGRQLRWPTHENKLYAIVHCLKARRYYVGGRKTKDFKDNIWFKYVDIKMQAISQELRWCNTIILMDAIKSSPEAVTSDVFFVAHVPLKKGKKHVMTPSGGRTRNLRWAS